MRGGKRVRAGNQVNWAEEEDVHSVECNVKRVKRRKKNEERG
jgi:hypothetical protein